MMHVAIVLAAALSYSDGLAECQRTGKPLVVFVACEPRPVPGFVVAHSRGLEGVRGPAIVLAVREGSRVGMLASMPASATDTELRGSVGSGRGVRAPHPRLSYAMPLWRTPPAGC